MHSTENSTLYRVYPKRIRNFCSDQDLIFTKSRILSFLKVGTEIWIVISYRQLTSLYQSLTHSLIFSVCLISFKITAIELSLCNKRCFYANIFYVWCVFSMSLTHSSSQPVKGVTLIAFWLTDVAFHRNVIRCRAYF